MRLEPIGCPEEKVERRDIGAPRQRNSDPIGAARSQPDQAAAPDEQLQDVERMIRE